jgi:hypothetical protein
MKTSDLINNQLVHGFKTADGFVSGLVEKEFDKIAVVGLSHENATGAVKPNESLFIDECCQNCFVAIVFNESGYIQNVRQFVW